MYKLTPIVILAMAISGCATSTPPPLLDALPIETGSHWIVADYQLLSSRLFAVQTNSGMQRYITQVLDNNPDFKSIAATASAAGFGPELVRSNMRPRIDLNVSGRRDKDALTGESGNSVSTDVEVSWVVDLWGKLADEGSAATYLAKQSVADLHQARRVLISQSAHAWVDYWGYVHTENKLLRLHMAYSNLRSHYQEAYMAGLVPYTFFLDAKNNQQRSQTRLQEIELARLKTQQYMNTLRGHYPADKLSIADDNIPFRLVAFTGEVPASTLAQRPDIQAAFMQLLAFDYTARAAHKALLPQINLTGSVLKSGESLQKIFSGNLVWQLIGGLTQPLFNGGQLKAYARQKSAESEASWWQFQKIVLDAMLEVEQALASEVSLGRQLTHKQHVLGDVEQKIRSTRERFNDGAVSVADFLQIDAEYIEAQIELTEKQLEYIGNRLNLVMALGLPIDELEVSQNELS